MKHEESLNSYLQASEYIDYFNAQIQDLISLFNQENELDRIKAVYEYIRDKIDHSYDIKI